jgi:polysaccharide export outer membrane protein
MEKKMKFSKLMQQSSLILACAFIFAFGVGAQDRQTSKMQTVPSDGKSSAKNVVEETPSEEESAIAPYYNNYLKEYHLGPEDVISVEVFSQPAYSKVGIVVPPTSRIAYPLIAGGVFVGGKTVEQVQEEIKKKLDEYIIDPQVTVTLDKVGSARFSVLGKVLTPGVKVMNRRYNVYEAVAEAGGIIKGGERKRVLLVRLNPQGGFTQTVIDFDKLMGGKTEVPYLLPNDQIIVPNKSWSLTQLMNVVTKLSFKIIFY